MVEDGTPIEPITKETAASNLESFMDMAEAGKFEPKQFFGFMTNLRGSGVGDDPEIKPIVEAVVHLGVRPELEKLSSGYLEGLEKEDNTKGVVDAIEALMFSGVGDSVVLQQLITDYQKRYPDLIQPPKDPDAPPGAPAGAPARGSVDENKPISVVREVAEYGKDEVLSNPNFGLDQKFLAIVALATYENVMPQFFRVGVDPNNPQQVDQAKQDYEAFKQAFPLRLFSEFMTSSKEFQSLSVVGIAEYSDQKLSLLTEDGKILEIIRPGSAFAQGIDAESSDHLFRPDLGWGERDFDIPVSSWDKRAIEYQGQQVMVAAYIRPAGPAPTEEEYIEFVKGVAGQGFEVTEDRQSCISDKAGKVWLVDFPYVSRSAKKEAASPAGVASPPVGRPAAEGRRVVEDERAEEREIRLGIGDLMTFDFRFIKDEAVRQEFLNTVSASLKPDQLRSYLEANPAGVLQISQENADTLNQLDTGFGEVLTDARTNLSSAQIQEFLDQDPLNVFRISSFVRNDAEVIPRVLGRINELDPFKLDSLLETALGELPKVLNLSPSFGLESYFRSGGDRNRHQGLVAFFSRQVGRIDEGNLREALTKDQRQLLKVKYSTYNYLGNNPKGVIDEAVSKTKFRFAQTTDPSRQRLAEYGAELDGIRQQKLELEDQLIGLRLNKLKQDADRTVQHGQKILEVMDERAKQMKETYRDREVLGRLMAATEHYNVLAIGEYPLKQSWDDPELRGYVTEFVGQVVKEVSKAQTPQDQQAIAYFITTLPLDYQRYLLTQILPNALKTGHITAEQDKAIGEMARNDYFKSADRDFRLPKTNEQIEKELEPEARTIHDRHRYPNSPINVSSYDVLISNINQLADQGYTGSAMDGIGRLDQEHVRAFLDRARQKLTREGYQLIAPWVRYHETIIYPEAAAKATELFNYVDTINKMDPNIQDPAKLLFYDQIINNFRTYPQKEFGEIMGRLGERNMSAFRHRAQQLLKDFNYKDLEVLLPKSDTDQDVSVDDIPF